jgi:hypothetical protein
MTVKEDIMSGKYNRWCERDVLVCPSESKQFSAFSVLQRPDLSQYVQDALYVHEATGCGGLEFVAFSNARIEKSLKLNNGVILHPCFLPGTKVTEIERGDPHDPHLLATKKMELSSRYIYDGWVPISSWDTENIQKCIRNVDEALSIFSLLRPISFQWEPKYHVSLDTQSVYPLIDEDLEWLENVVRPLDKLNEKDRKNIYRSIAWISQSYRLYEPAAHFLFLILAIESLATYIEKEKMNEDSPLQSLKKAKKFTREEKEICIDGLLATEFKDDKIRAIDKAYFTCVKSITKTLREHLTEIFKPETSMIDLLFNDKIDGMSLYDIRHEIAHGEADAISEAKRDYIRQRSMDVELVARKYISKIIKTCTGVEPHTKDWPSSISLPLGAGLASSSTMHLDPVYMDLQYY